MKHIFKQSLVSLFFFALIGSAYAVVTYTPHANVFTGDTITSSSWNDIVNDLNSYNGANQLMRMHSDGSVGIGTVTPSEKLEVVGNIKASADVYANNYYYNSDRRLKENIFLIPSALEKVQALNGVRFDWKKNGESALGFIAQEIEAVLPELVHTNAQGYKSVQYGNIVAVLVEAIKEQSKKEAQQEQRIQLLEKQVAILSQVLKVTNNE